MVREVRCLASPSLAPVASSFCAGALPPSTQACAPPPCVSYACKVSPVRRTQRSPSVSAVRRMMCAATGIALHCDVWTGDRNINRDLHDGRARRRIVSRCCFLLASWTTVPAELRGVPDGCVPDQGSCSIDLVANNRLANSAGAFADRRHSCHRRSNIASADSYHTSANVVTQGSCAID